MKDTSQTKIRAKLIEEGQRLFDGPKEFRCLSGEKEADKLLNDLDKHPHAFVLGCAMDRQIRAEKAWLIPFRFAEKLGDSSFEAFSNLSLRKIRHLMSEPEPLHRFVEIMAKVFHSAVRRIESQYDGKAGRIWSGKPSSAEVVYRFLEFEGIGPKIASMAANILAREFKVPLVDYSSIDISADVHVKRVFSRLGLCPDNPSVNQVIYKARALNPEFPGIMDFPAFEIGRKWCKKTKPLCSACYINKLCPSAQTQW